MHNAGGADQHNNRAKYRDDEQVPRGLVGLMHGATMRYHVTESKSDFIQLRLIALAFPAAQRAHRVGVATIWNVPSQKFPDELAAYVSLAASMPQRARYDRRNKKWGLGLETTKDA